MRIVELFLFERLSVCKLGKYWQGVCLVGWTEVGPCETVDSGTCRRAYRISQPWAGLVT